jgi:succinyl-diaminopimelate desuccinylase
MNKEKLRTKEKIEKKAVEYRQQIIDMLCDLIAIPTINPPGQAYRQCVDYLSKVLSEWKINHNILAVPNGKYPRFSIVGSCGNETDGIHFHGHFDVVPAQISDQFQPQMRGNLIYGRGSSDMKGGLVAMLFAMRTLKDLALEKLPRITFSIVPNEETGSSCGTKYLFDSSVLPRRCLGMLMPEPTSGIIWNANKGALTYNVILKGKAAHVSLASQGINSFEQMIAVVHSLMKLKKEIHNRKTTMKVTPPEACHSIMLIGGESGSGINFNVVPDRAFFTIDRRINPEENLEAAKEEIIKIIDQHRRQAKKIDVEIIREGESASASQKSLLALALHQAIFDVTGKAADFELCPGLLEIRFFNNQEIPAYAYGPGLLEVAHGPDEYVNINHILDCIKIYALTAVWIFN